MAYKIWTEDEIKILREHYPRQGINWCADKLNRSCSAVRRKVQRDKIRRDQKYKKRTSSWGGYKGVGGSQWYDLNRSAKKRGYEVSITIEQAWELYLQQDKRCKLSGLPIRFAQPGENKNQTTASLDRIDSNGHYSLDNVQWVHKDVNSMKMALPEQQFVEYCRLIAQHNEETNDNDTGPIGEETKREEHLCKLYYGQGVEKQQNY